MPDTGASLKVKQIAGNIRRLSEKDQRKLAALVLQDQGLEAFVEELEDSLACEKAIEEGAAELFTAEELTHI